MEQLAFWVFIAAGAYMIIFEGLLRVRRNSKRYKQSAERIGTKPLRIAIFVMGALLIGLAFLWYF